MAKEEIILRLKPDGTREVEGMGFVGPACAKATAKLLSGLGKGTNTTRKPDFYKKEENKQREVGW